MRALVVVALLGAAGCGDVDPCAAAKDACLALFVKGQGVNAVDQLQIATVSGYAAMSETTPQPPLRRTLPVAVAVHFNPPPTSDVVLSVAGLSSGSVVAAATVQASIGAGHAQKVDVTLVGGAQPSGLDGGSDGGGTSALGSQCVDPSQCASGFCVDGVCCESSCAGACKYCAAPGALGMCTNSLAGTNWRMGCAVDNTNPCGTDGTCDGNGACKLRPMGTQCSPQSCTSGTVTLAAACDGNGTCMTPATRQCAPYNCNATGTDCYATCTGTGATECSPPNTCTSGSCGPASNGATCNPANNGTDCMSGHCVDGVCCDTACTGLCQACNITGTVGTCSNLPSGTTSTTDCPQDPISTCGKDGTCDGSGACHLYAAGSVCMPSSCNVNVFTSAQTCNGSGSCGGSTTTNCGDYVCDNTYGCYTGCNTAISIFQCKPSSAYCTSGHTCGCTGGGTQVCSCTCN